MKLNTKKQIIFNGGKMENDIIEMDYIRYKVYEEEYDNEVYICIDIWDKKTKKATGFKISTDELDILNISEDSFRMINRSYMLLFNRLRYDGDME